MYLSAAHEFNESYSAHQQGLIAEKEKEDLKVRMMQDK